MDNLFNIIRASSFGNSSWISLATVHLFMFRSMSSDQKIICCPYQSVDIFAGQVIFVVFILHYKMFQVFLDEIFSKFSIFSFYAQFHLERLIEMLLRTMRHIHFQCVFCWLFPDMNSQIKFGPNVPVRFGDLPQQVDWD